jgi:DNA-binding beta-propeller fold protein YncE
MRLAPLALGAGAAAVLLFAQSASLTALKYKVVPNWPDLPAGWNFQETAATAVDAATGHVWVIHRGPHPVMEFTAAGKLVRSFGDGMYDRPHGIRVDTEGNLWTVDDGAHVVLKYDRTGRIRMVLGRWKQSSAQLAPADAPPAWGARAITDKDLLRFNRPTDVAWDASGNIYVSDGYGNSRVVKFSREGRYVTEWGRRGQAAGEFNTPHAVVVDKRGRVYVADRENYRIQVFDGDGKFIEQWQNVGSPWGLQIGADQTLWMADGYNGRVLKLSLEGRILGAFGSLGKMPGELLFVHHLSVGPDNSIYTAEILNWRPQKFVSQ